MGKHTAPRSEEHKQRIREAVRASWSEERRAEFSKARSGANNPAFGTQHTEEWKANLREQNSGENNPFAGKQHSDEAKKIISAAKTGRAPRLYKYGISDEEYSMQLASGNKWCCGHSAFLPVAEFPPRPTSGRCKRCIWVAMLKSEYGVTPEWYEQKLAEQGGKCAICSAVRSTLNLAVDHCHVTQKNRGIICGRCNTALERLETIPDWAAKALAYLASYPWLKFTA